jgi:hypothetical protein
MSGTDSCILECFLFSVQKMLFSRLFSNTLEVMSVTYKTIVLSLSRTVVKDGISVFFYFFKVENFIIRGYK